MAANFEYYKIFYYVAKYQNFTLAAKALLSSQPSVSRCMQALETELGCRLFIRTKRGVSLTAEGEQLYPADTVIYAVGQRPLAEEAEQFHFCAPEFYTIGDCVTPATIYQATSQAFYAARDIGRL